MRGRRLALKRKKKVPVPVAPQGKPREAIRPARPRAEVEGMGM